jgi:hypothetical protein
MFPTKTAVLIFDMLADLKNGLTIKYSMITVMKKAAIRSKVSGL